MKRIFLSMLIFLICVPFTIGQTNNLKENRKGSLLGTGIGFNKYKTSWIYGDWGNQKRPYHGFSRTGIYAEYEYRSLFKPGTIQFDLNVNLFFGLAGKTMDYWTTDDETISDGGATVSGGVLLKAAIPIQILSTTLMTPYTGCGFQYIGLGSNGKGVSNLINQEYRYDEGWYESIFGVPWILGVEVDLGKYVFSVEYGLLIGGGTSTSWDPAGPDVEQHDNPEMNTISIGVGFKL